MADLPLPLGTELAGNRFILRTVLGEGGMGVVYGADDRQGGSLVAVKALKVGANASLVERLRREVRVLCALAHPCIVRVHVAGVHGEKIPFFVMDLVLGGTLTSRVEDRGPLSWDSAASMFVKLFDALDHAHGRGVLHRDIKPDNILVASDEDGTPLPKVVDFGLAKAVGRLRDDMSVPDLTRPGSLFGTIGFMSPEQAIGRVLTPVTDVYSMAATLRYALTGEPVVAGRTAAEILRNLARMDPTPIQGRDGLSGAVLLALNALLFRALARDPAGRPSAREVRDELLRMTGRPAPALATMGQTPIAADGGWFWGPGGAPAPDAAEPRPMRRLSMRSHRPAMVTLPDMRRSLRARSMRPSRPLKSRGPKAERAGGRYLVSAVLVVAAAVVGSLLTFLILRVVGSG